MPLGANIRELNMFNKFSSSKLFFTIIALSAAVLSGCIKAKDPQKTAILLKTENTTQAELMKEVNRFARVDSLRAKMYFKLEDNSFAQYGSKDVYKTADGEVVVQRPANIFLKVQIPVIKSDVAQMTSDGEKFRVAVLLDNSGGKYKKFVKGSNKADYSTLQRSLESTNGNGSKEVKENVSAFANMRPQHFTDAMLVRPTDDAFMYTQSTIFQIEEDVTSDKKSPIRKVNRGYYLLDEYAKQAGGELVIARRFWFDRVGGIRLARQQIFDAKGEIESDIVYGAEGNLTDTGQYNRLPLQVTVTRPQEKYSMRLTYQIPEDVKIGDKYPPTAFLLQNSWGLEEVDLDRKLQESTAQKPQPPGSAANNSNSASRFQ